MGIKYKTGCREILFQFFPRDQGFQVFKNDYVIIVISLQIAKPE